MSRFGLKRRVLVCYFYLLRLILGLVGVSKSIRLEQRFGMTKEMKLIAVLACLVVVVFPSGKAVAGEAGQDEKNASAQTSNLTQTNNYPDLRLNKDLFKRYLENPYPVRKVVFFQPLSFFMPTEVLLCKGSLQPDVFYMQQQDSPKVLEGGKYKNVS